VQAASEGAVAEEENGVEAREREVDDDETAVNVEYANTRKQGSLQFYIRANRRKYAKDLPHVLRQREPMHHIAGADDKIELERTIFHEHALVVTDYDVVGTEHLDVLRVMPRGGRAGEGIDLGSDGVGKENCVVTL
jgi:hypothetical protein